MGHIVVLEEGEAPPELQHRVVAAAMISTPEGDSPSLAQVRWWHRDPQLARIETGHQSRALQFEHEAVALPLSLLEAGVFLR